MRGIVRRHNSPSRKPRHSHRSIYECAHRYLEEQDEEKPCLLVFRNLSIAMRLELRTLFAQRHLTDSRSTQHSLTKLQRKRTVSPCPTTQVIPSHNEAYSWTFCCSCCRFLRGSCQGQLCSQSSSFLTSPRPCVWPTRHHVPLPPVPRIPCRLLPYTTTRRRTRTKSAELWTRCGQRFLSAARLSMGQ